MRAPTLAPYLARAQLPPPSLTGVITRVLGMLVEAVAPGAAVGDFFNIDASYGSVRAEVVALKESAVVLLPYGQLQGLKIGAPLSRSGSGMQVMCGPNILGRVLDPMGVPLDGGPTPHELTPTPMYRRPLTLAERRPVKQRLATGIKCLDAFVPLGMGQRLGIFAGPGVGKSTLLGMMAKGCAADVLVLGLIGERGREVGHFVDDVLGEAGLKKAVVISATSDRPSSERVRAAFVATAIAEYFRDQGRHVLLFIDSLSRLCMAQRDIGLATGEPPTRAGYPPSAFTLLPRLLERVAPARGKGSITGLYTILVDGDDMTEPVADAARGLLDGHIILDRSLATRGHFPAVNVLQSLSRLESDLMPGNELQAARQVRAALSRLDETRELRAIGAYQAGSDAQLDVALRNEKMCQAFLQQDSQTLQSLSQTQSELMALSSLLRPHNKAADIQQKSNLR